MRDEAGVVQSSPLPLCPFSLPFLPSSLLFPFPPLLLLFCLLSSPTFYVYVQSARLRSFFPLLWRIQAFPLRVCGCTPCLRVCGVVGPAFVGVSLAAFVALSPRLWANLAPRLWPSGPRLRVLLILRVSWSTIPRLRGPCLALPRVCEYVIYLAFASVSASLSCLS